MNLDAVARLIASASFVEFRTICLHFLQLTGLTSATYCDGPYDGGADFALEPIGELRPAVQISIEGEWKPKLKLDVKNLKKNITQIWFTSSPVGVSLRHRLSQQKTKY